MHVELGPDSPPAERVDFDAFLAVDIRVGTVLEARPSPEARKPAYVLRVDFGPVIGVLRASAQITALYAPEALEGRQVLGVVNLPPRQIGPVRSEALILGLTAAAGRIALAGPDRPIPNGTRLT
jgi:tRNA-binding protein